MGRSQETFGKREREKKRLRKRQEKQQKKEARKEDASGGGLDDMIAYVDEFGNITDTPPDPTHRKKIKAENIPVSVPKKEEVDIPEVQEGRVEFFNDDKGYGFIKSYDTQEKYFYHVKGTLEEIQEGDKVSFELEMTPKGPNAIQVKRI